MSATTDDIISRCYEHGQPDYVLAADHLRDLQAAIYKAYALLWRNMGEPSPFAKEARKLLRDLLTYEETQAAIRWVKEVHPIDDDETEAAVMRAREFFWQKADQYDREKLQATYNDLLALQDQTDQVPLTRALDAVGFALKATQNCSNGAQCNIELANFLKSHQQQVAELFAEIERLRRCCPRCMGSGYSSQPGSAEICEACDGDGRDPRR